VDAAAGRERQGTTWSPPGAAQAAVGGKVPSLQATEAHAHVFVKMSRHQLIPADQHESFNCTSSIHCLLVPSQVHMHMHKGAHAKGNGQRAMLYHDVLCHHKLMSKQTTTSSTAQQWALCAAWKCKGGVQLL
jgi:hypothetical protein